MVDYLKEEGITGRQLSPYEGTPKC